METEQGIWIQSKDDGIILFKNVTSSLKEQDKEEK